MAMLKWSIYSVFSPTLTMIFAYMVVWSVKRPLSFTRDVLYFFRCFLVLANSWSSHCKSSYWIVNFWKLAYSTANVVRTASQGQLLRALPISVFSASFLILFAFGRVNIFHFHCVKSIFQYPHSKHPENISPRFLSSYEVFVFTMKPRAYL